MNIPNMINIPEAGGYPNNFVANWPQAGPKQGLGGGGVGNKPSVQNMLQQAQSLPGVNNQQAASEQHYVHVRPPAGFNRRVAENLGAPQPLSQPQPLQPHKKVDIKNSLSVDKEMRKFLESLPTSATYRAPEVRRNSPAYEPVTYNATFEEIKANLTNIKDNNNNNNNNNHKDKKMYDILTPRMSTHRKGNK